MADVIQSLKKVVEKTVDVLDESKQDVFTIAESSRNEYDKIVNELQLLHQDINQVIDDLDKLERINKQARVRLMQVSRDFHQYTERDIKKAYQQAEDTSVKIAVLQEKEDQLKKRRLDLEKRLRDLEENIEKAENLVSRLGVIRNFLTGELSSVSEQYDDLRKKEQLAIKIIQAQEEERKRLARDIHDGPAQSIANLVFRVELTQKLLDKDIDKARSELEDLKKLIRLSMQDVRKIIYDLRPMSLDDLGLIPTLERYIEKFIRQTELRVDLNVLGAQKRLPNTYEVTIFRLIQEALNNINKHAQATSGKIRLEFQTNRINIMISDNGIGFNSENVAEGKYGLISMKERCELLGGTLEIKSSPYKGTVILIILPLGSLELQED